MTVTPNRNRRRIPPSSDLDSAAGSGDKEAEETEPGARTGKGEQRAHAGEKRHREREGAGRAQNKAAARFTGQSMLNENR